MRARSCEPSARHVRTGSRPSSAPLSRRVRALPGVTAVGAVNVLPLGGDVWSKNLTLYDRPLPRDSAGCRRSSIESSAGDYFRALGIPILSGRPFTDAGRSPRSEGGDRQPGAGPAPLSRSEPDWQGGLGRILRSKVLPRAIIEEARRAGALPDGYEPDKFTIVGVAADVRYGGLEKAALPVVYVPCHAGVGRHHEHVLAVRTLAIRSRWCRVFARRSCRSIGNSPSPRSRR